MGGNHNSTRKRGTGIVPRLRVGLCKSTPAIREPALVTRRPRYTAFWLGLGFRGAFGFVDFGSGAEMDFAGIHQGFGEGWVRVDGIGDVMDFASHLDR